MAENSNSASQSKLTLGCFGLMVVLGLAMVIFGIFFIIEGNESRSWPTAEGSVVTTFVRSRTEDNNSRTFTYEVTYSYTVDGQFYTADRYSLGEGSTASGRFSTELEARNAADEAFPTGSLVLVSYDPDDPSSAVLSPGANWGTYMPLVLGLFFMISGIGLFLALRRAPGQKEEQPI